MYSSSRAKKIVKNDVAFLSAGIHDNVHLIGIRYETSIQDNSFIEFKFEKEGRIMTHTEWEPRKKTAFGELTQEEFELKCDKQFSRVKQILECFYDEDKLQFEGESFKEYAKWVVGLLSADNIKDKALRVKVIYNDKGYTTLPKYAKYTFIEPMSTVDAGESMITKLGIDLFEKPIVADVEKQNANPFQVVNGTLESVDVTTSNNSEDDLPF